MNKTQIHFVSHLFQDCKKHELLLPIASYSEQNGTLINEDGILQKFEAGLCNEKKNLLELLHIINATPETVEQVWDEILAETFGLAYETIPVEGKQL
jgi:NADH dehydrogenase/NADH:ubiquinone oxidoreductase subunit G